MTGLNRILHVEDDEDILMIARLALADLGGFEVLQCSSGAEALEKAQAFRPDLLLLDFMMPGMNGFGALRAIRKDPSTQHIPVVMISGNEHATEQFYANKIGADDFMKKPFSRFEVFAHIELLLDAERMPRRKGAPPEVPPRVYRDLQSAVTQPQPHPQP